MENNLPDIQASAPWPHPDRAIIALYRYFEARTPPSPPGTFRIEGMWPEVQLAFYAINVALAGMLGACLGPLAAWLTVKRRRRRLLSAANGPHHSVWVRGAIVAVWLLVAVLAGWFLFKMEQTRRQWQDQSRWAKAGASALYENGKLVGLRFNVLTLSMQHFGTKSLGDADLSRFKDLTDLEDLGLTDSQVTDNGLGQLAKLTELRWLELDGTRITDAGLVGLVRFPKLERLDLSRTRVTDMGLSDLAKLPNLHILILLIPRSAMRASRT